MTTWTFEGYWNTVLGTGTAAQVVREHELVAAGLDEWLGTAEAEAWSAGGRGGPLPDEWSSFHARALTALQAALSGSVAA